MCYHAVCKSVVMGEIVCTHEDSVSNPVDSATKSLLGGVKQDFLVSKILYSIMIERLRNVAGSEGSQGFFALVYPKSTP
jgi:hypothetical protein